MSKKKKSQKILIPRGTIDPNEDTLIEIPVDLKRKPVIVASKNGAERSFRANRSSGSFISSQNDFDESMFDQTISNRSISGIRQNESYFTPNTSSSEYRTALDLDSTVIADLNVTDQEEKMLVQRKLEAFQDARRQFLLETTHVATKRTQTLNDSEYNQPSKIVRQCSSRKSFQIDDIPANSTFSSERFGKERSKHVQTRFIDDDPDVGSSCRCSSK